MRGTGGGGETRKRVDVDNEGKRNERDIVKEKIHDVECTNSPTNNEHCSLKKEVVRGVVCEC